MTAYEQSVSTLALLCLVVVFAAIVGNWLRLLVLRGVHAVRARRRAARRGDVPTVRDWRAYPNDFSDEWRRP